MYQIFFDGLPLYDPRGEEAKLIVRNPDCHLPVGEAGYLNFTIDVDHPYAGALTKMKGVLELRADGIPIYKGRIVRDTQDFDLARDIESEGLLACLNDSIIAPFDFPTAYLDNAEYQTAAERGNVIRFFLERIFAQHNSQVGAEQQVRLGDVTVTDPNNYISRASSEYLTTREVLQQKITDLLGGYLLVDYSSDVTTVHYYAELPLTNTQTVEFGENLLDLKRLIDASAVHTAVLPIGADGLTIESLPDAEVSPGYFKEGNIIYSREAETLYGGNRITRKMVWDDVTLATNLQRKALQHLSTEGVWLSQTITVKAIDLSGESGAEQNISRFVVGRHVELASTPHGLSVTYPLTVLDPDILNPGNTSITMGATIKASSDLAHSNQNANREQLNKHQLQLDQHREDITVLTQTTLEQITSAIQTAESIILSALESYVQTSNYEEFRSSVESQLSVMADEIAIKFTQTTDSVSNVNGDLQRVVEKLEKHFDFTLENGLVIKAGENAMTLTLDNDLIIFKRNGQQFGWWDGIDFHTGNIVIEVNERAQFGAFAFVPRSNRSLSFLKVGE